MRWGIVRVPEELLRDIDNLLRKHNYVSRSEFVRDAVREKIDEIRGRRPRLVEARA